MRFWKATMPVKRNSRDEISRKMSALRRSVSDDLTVAGPLSIRWHSWRNVPMHCVTVWHASISAEQSETRKSFSSLPDAAVRSGISSDVWPSS